MTEPCKKFEAALGLYLALVSKDKVGAVNKDRITMLKLENKYSTFTHFNLWELLLPEHQIARNVFERLSDPIGYYLELPEIIELMQRLNADIAGMGIDGTYDMNKNITSLFIKRQNKSMPRYKTVIFDLQNHRFIYDYPYPTLD